MKINTKKLNEIFTPSNVPGINGEVYTTSSIERSLIETVLFKAIQNGKLNKTEKSLLKNYDLIAKKSK